MKPFEDKTAFVSEGSKGIGFACALRLPVDRANGNGKKPRRLYISS